MTQKRYPNSRGVEAPCHRGSKNVSYDTLLCPVIAKGQRVPNAQLTHQIVDRHHEELKSSGLDSQTLKNPF